MGKVRLWDAPVRLFHWSVVALFGALWWTGENGKIDLHKTIVLVMLGLVAVSYTHRDVYKRQLARKPL